MGYLHDGHLSLVKKSKKTADITVVSVFVNPTQFSPDEDLKKYPRSLSRDRKLLKKQGVDYLFFPDVNEIYPENYQTYVEVNQITKSLEGESRPSHFKGVTTIVSILFNTVNPDHVFFGQKDAQQAAVVIQMVKDLKFDVKVHVCPIIREPDGLALSSRNVYLSPQERKEALVLSTSLKLASSLIKKGESNTARIIKEMSKIVNSVKSSRLDYIKITEAGTFNEVSKLTKGEDYYILIACKIGMTRLIDNIKMKF